MHRFADITELVPDRSVVQVPDTEAATGALYEQIAQEGIDTAMLVYPQNGTYAVVDDHLRLEALRRLRRDGRLPSAISKLGVPIVLLAESRTALFRAADRVFRAQVSAAAEALYLQRLFAALETTPPNAVGGSSDSEDRAAPAAHQPGRTGLLRKRYRLHSETARKAVRRSEVPESVLLACLDDANVTRRALTAAGTAIHLSPDRDPKEIAWETLATFGQRSDRGPAGRSQNNEHATAAHSGEPKQADDTDASADGSAEQAAHTVSVSGDKLATLETTQRGASGRGDSEQVTDDPAQYGLKLASFMNHWPQQVRRRFLKSCFDNLTAQTLADVHGTLEAVSAGQTDPGDTAQRDGDGEPSAAQRSLFAFGSDQADDDAGTTQDAMGGGPA